MFSLLARYWWVLVLRGAIAILFGLLAIFLPIITMATLVVVFGAFALADGVLALISTFSSAAHGRRWALVLEGVAGIAAGIITFLWPAITAFALLYVIAAWAIVTGVFEIIAAVELRKELTNEWLLGLLGVASVIFGVLIVLFPGAGALAVLSIIAAFAIASGVVQIALGLRLRGQRPGPGVTAASAGR